MADSDSIKRSILLEKRITRLEKLIKNERWEDEDCEDESLGEDEEFESFRRNTRRTFRNESTKRRWRSRFHK